MTSLSGLLGGLGNAILPSVGCAQFVFILPILMVAGVSGLGLSVSVSAWVAWAVSARASNAGHLDPIVRILGENASVLG